MNLSPWDYYAADGSLNPNARTAEQLLVKALQLHPEHTHALHLYIHVAEAGAPVPSPGLEHLSAARGLASAEKLSELNSQNGHLLHMPSHIFVRTGRYKRAVEVNKVAYDFDLARGTHCIAPYLPEHNVNMLVYAARSATIRHLWLFDFPMGLLPFPKSRNYATLTMMVFSCIMNVLGLLAVMCSSSNCLAYFLPPPLRAESCFCFCLCRSMAGMAHTAEAYAKGMRSLRNRMPDTWIARGSEWVSLPLLYIR
jgi:hypothetical protein